MTIQICDIAIRRGWLFVAVGVLIFGLGSHPGQAQDVDATVEDTTVTEAGETATAKTIQDPPDAAAATGPKRSNFEETLNNIFAKINSYIATALFFSISGKTIEIPFVVAVLVLGSVFFTFWFGWINIRGLKHSIDLIRGRFDRPEDAGEISHFRALTSSLSATVGLGNIAGVAFAVTIGGPGAVFWMLLLAVFGMSAKFSSCTLAQLYRKTNPDGSISGGPMYYLDLGLRAKGPVWGVLGKVLAIMFALMCIGGALGGGNMFQSNQAFAAFAAAFDISTVDAATGADNPWPARSFGIILAVLVAVVILGGIKRIGLATSRIVPTMCGVYVIASLVIIISNAEKIPGVIQLIFSEAFTLQAGWGGAIGVMIWGFKRAAFSNEAGLGSAAIAHSAAKTNEPVREGLVAMIGPFIDTIIVCFMTAMVVIITGAYNDPVLDGAKGVEVTTHAFRSLSDWFPYVLSVCIVLFAYSTMISWCYYGERSWTYLFGDWSLIIFRLAFVYCVFLGAVADIGNVLDFADLMILCMAFPNIVGSIILAPYVKRKVNDYWSRYKSGQMKPVE